MSAPTLSRPQPTRQPLVGVRRIRLLAGFLIVVGLVFGMRLVQLQAVTAEVNADRAGNERRTTEELAAPRGAILDRTGQPLAVTVEAVDVVADQTLVVEPTAAAAQLAQLLQVEADWLREQLSGEQRYVPIAKAVSPQVWDAVVAARIPGLFGEPASAREYPSGATAGAVIGFIGADGEGLSGIESGYEAVLAGKAGSRTFERGADGSQIPTAASAEVAVTAGSDIRLTLDRDIQWAADSAIAAQVKATKAESGTVVVLDPRTGEILALATAPTVDPRNPAAADPADRGNRALTEVFEPGSTAKVMTMAAVLEEGTLQPDSVLTVDDNLRRSDKTFRDHTPHEVQRLTLTGVLAKSSNVGTILAAETLPTKNVLHEYQQRFGIGSPTGVDLPGESSGKLPAPEEWSGTTFPTLAFGQGMSINAVQLADIFGTIANDGVRIAPSIVAGRVDQSGEFIPAAAARSSRVVSAETAAKVRLMLEAAVSDEGTAPKTRIPGYRVGGKTGTAQRVDPACGCYRGYTASFVGMAPADDPELVVAVVLQRPQRGHYGGLLAGPVFKDVMTFALQSQRVAPSGGELPKLTVFAP